MTWLVRRIWNVRGSRKLRRGHWFWWSSLSFRLKSPVRLARVCSCLARWWSWLRSSYRTIRLKRLITFVVRFYRCARTTLRLYRMSRVVNLVIRLFSPGCEWSNVIHDSTMLRDACRWNGRFCWRWRWRNVGRWECCRTCWGRGRR